MRRFRFVQSTFPRSHYINAETPRARRFFRTTYDTGSFVVGFVVAVSINGRRARLKPHPRGARRSGYRFANDLRGLHARVYNQPAILIVVSAVHASPGEIDYYIRAFKFRGPVPERLCIPFRNGPWRSLWASAENDHLIAALMNRAGEDFSDLSCSARN